MILATFIVFMMSGVGICACYHRLYAHRAYKINKVVEGIILFFATLAVQNTAIQWSHNHRLHHAHVEEEKDPYNIKKGFWHAHILWLLENTVKFDPSLVSDLMENKLTVFQDKYYLPLTFGSNILVWLFVGWLLHDFWGAFVMVLWLRIFFVHHFTFFINSLAHTWGERTYAKEQTAVDNFLMAFFSFGEGYHNYHHVFASDYRNGVRWWQFDPTKWLIWSLSKIGLAHELTKVDKYVIKKRLLNEDKHVILNYIGNAMDEKMKEFETKIHEVSERFNARVAEINSLLREYKASKKIKIKQEVKRLKIDIKAAKKKLNQDWKEWITLCRAFTRAYPQINKSY